MPYYINPKSIRDPIRREYLKAAEKFGAEIRVKVLEITESFARAIVEIEASKELLRALRHLGISFSKEPMPARFSFRSLVQLLEKTVEEIPIGLGENSNVIRVDVSKPVAVDDLRIALYLSRQPLLLVDLVGDQIPDPEFTEIDGFPIPSSETKLYDLASILARAFNKKVEQIVGVIKAKVQKLTADEETILLPMPEIDELFRWAVLVEEGQIPPKAYIDLTGLPLIQQRLALKIAASILTHDLIIVLPYPWKWIAKSIRRRHTFIVAKEPQELDFPTIITDNKVIKRVVVKGRIMSREINYEPFWKIIRFLP